MPRPRKLCLPLLLIGAMIAVSMLSRAAVAASVADDVQSLIAAKLPAERVAVHAVALGGGKPLVDINSDTLMSPASCVKLVTAAAALKELGVDYRFRTEFLSDEKPDAGIIDTLYIRGNGDPFITPEALWRMSKALIDHGIHRIRGDVIIDDSFFATHRYPGKLSGSHQAYEALTSAVATNFNVVEFIVAPGDRVGGPAHVSTDPESPYVRVINRVKTGTHTRVSVSQQVNDDYETFTVYGEVTKGSKLTTVARSISHPVRFAGALFGKLMKQHGIQLDGTVRAGVIPAHATLLFDEPSRPLALLVREMDKWSSNFIAEQITKHLGGKRSGKPGTTEYGLMATREWLRSIGIKSADYVLENGSGLSGKSRFTARQLVRVLTAAAADPAIGPDFMSSLSILGIDGTMRDWQAAPALRGLLRAKTGTLLGVSALAGYVPDQSGRLIAFAVMAKGLQTGIWDARNAQAEIALAISKSRSASDKVVEK